MSDVVVIGAGLSGLCIAYELAGRGAAVQVAERSEPGRGASWAGAGMLAPFTEEIADSAMLQLCERSLACYPRFVAGLRDESGIDPHFQINDTLSVAFDEAQVGILQARAHRLTQQGVKHAVFDRRQTLEAEPAVSPHAFQSLLVTGEGQVDNRRLTRALLRACQQRGVRVSGECGTVAVEADSRRVLGVRTQVGFNPATTVVNATGAWAADLPCVPASCIPAVFPVKGQMLALAVPKNFFHRPVWVPGAYLVPRSDGRLLIGATVERCGFDVRVTADAIHGLLGSALAAAPTLSGFTLTETWAGLRAGTPDGMPVISRTALGGYYLATGHFRNGILLAPMTGVLTADLIEGKRNDFADAFAMQTGKPEAINR